MVDADEHDSGTAAESQASQLLKNALQSDSEEESLRTSNTMPVDEPDATKDFSSESGNPHPVPHYHYHGLATTQTQSQNNDEERKLNEGGSRNENVHSNRDASSSSGNPLQSAMQPFTHLAKASRVDKTNPLLSGASANTKVVSFQSTKAATTLLNPARYTGRPLERAPPCRRDSFADDFEDPAEKLIASSKQFDIPIAQLGRMASPSMRYSSKIEHEGTILVASTPTPSVSGSSQSQSQPRPESQQSHPLSQSQGIEDNSDEYAMNPRQPDDDSAILPPVDASAPGSQTSTQYLSSEPTSSYRNMYARLTSPLEPTQPFEPTQLEPTQAVLDQTQPVSQSPAATSTEQRGGTFSNGINTTGHARTLFDTLDENKRRRYAVHSGQASHVNNDSADATFNTVDSAARTHFPLQETQPAFDEGHSSPSRTTAKPQSISTPPRPRRTLLDERTEIIPDSEPMREASTSPVPQAKLSNKSPATPFRRCPGSDTETDPEVRDSMDVDVGNRDNVLKVHSERREEEEDEEELIVKEEVEQPLNLKGKGKAKQMSLPRTKNTQAKAQKDSRPSVKSGRKKVSAPPAKKARIPAPSFEVPSSVPHQDNPRVDPPNAKPKPKAKSAAATRVRKYVSDDEDENEHDEFADEDYTELGPSARKRKRGNKTESPVVSRQPQQRRTAPSQQARRTRAASRNDTASDATRVFALWRKDGNYYSGVVHSMVASGRYKINFDDNTTDEVNIEDMRLCKLNVGDAVFVIGVPGGAVEVTDVSNFDEERVVVDRLGFSRTCHVSELRVASRTVSSHWKERCLEFIMCVEKPRRSVTSPAPSGISVSSVGTSRKAPNLFSRFGFCITHPQSDVKKRVATYIRSSGGSVIDDWGEAFPVIMKGNQASGRLLLEWKDAIPRFRGVDRVFLLADDASQTAKYLIALALGIPCLRIDFIENAIEKNNVQDWPMYLLPSGFSDLLQCRVSQFVDVDWNDHDTNDMMRDPVAYKPLKEKKILCFSKKIFEKDHVNRMVPNVVLAMGAKWVEAVFDMKRAKHPISNYDYVVVDDNENWRTADARGCPCVVPWEWLKNALISRCIPPIPPIPTN